MTLKRRDREKESQKLVGRTMREAQVSYPRSSLADPRLCREGEPMPYMFSAQGKQKSWMSAASGDLDTEMRRFGDRQNRRSTSYFAKDSMQRDRFLQNQTVDKAGVISQLGSISQSGRKSYCCISPTSKGLSCVFGPNYERTGTPLPADAH